LLQNKARKGVRRCAGGRGRDYEGEGRVVFTDGAEIDDWRWRRLRIPTRNFVGSSRFSRKRRKGNEGGVLGLFIEGVSVERGLGFRGESRSDGGAVSGSAGSPCQRKRAKLTGGVAESEGEGGTDAWGPPIGGRTRERRYPFGFGSGWAVGQFQSWARSVPRGPFHVFSSFLSFLFLFSYFFHNFFKFGPN
jgi:hypothetical protein